MKSIAVCFFVFLFFSKTFSQTPYDPALTPFFDSALKPFYFGVASGDPHADGVVIWTKIVPENTDNQSVNWQVATDTLMQNIVQSGTEQTDSSSAFTVKIEVKNLLPGQYYFFRFQHQNTWSAIGRTRTLKTGDPSQVRLAVGSCTNFPGGYFNSFGLLARQNDIDAVLFLGDYIYEYGNWRGGRKRMRKKTYRQHIPDHTLVNITDYRTRYAQYRLDPQLMECHRVHPFIVVWDDHEIANNAHATGAQNHNPAKDGTWETRKATAKQAYFEWQCIRENPGRDIIRSFSFGNLAELWMLDERLEARSPQVKSAQDPAAQSPEQRMLGEEQMNWLLNGMANSKARWKAIGNQVIFSQVNDSKVFSRRPEISADRWDGYPTERRQMFDFFEKNNLRNIIFVTGDVHTSWAFELTSDPADPSKYDPKTGKGVIGAEFITPSTSSFNFDEVVPKFITWEAKRRFKKKKNNRHLRYLDLNRHGFLTVTFTPERAEADWFFVKTLKKVDSRGGRKAGRYIEFNGQKILKN